MKNLTTVSEERRFDLLDGVRRDAYSRCSACQGQVNRDGSRTSICQFELEYRIHSLQPPSLTHYPSDKQFTTFAHQIAGWKWC